MTPSLEPVALTGADDVNALLVRDDSTCGGCPFLRHLWKGHIHNRRRSVTNCGQGRRDSRAAWLTQLGLYLGTVVLGTQPASGESERVSAITATQRPYLLCVLVPQRPI